MSLVRAHTFSRPCFSDHKVIETLLLTVRDITDRKRLQTEVDEARPRIFDWNNALLMSCSWMCGEDMSALVHDWEDAAESGFAFLDQMLKEYKALIHKMFRKEGPVSMGGLLQIRELIGNCSIGLGSAVTRTTATWSGIEQRTLSSKTCATSWMKAKGLG